MERLKIIVTIALLSLGLSLSVSDFKPAFFHSSQPSGFYTIETGIPNTGEILAFGDLNGDKYTDYLAIDNRSIAIIQVYYWSDSSSTFSVDSFSMNFTNSTNFSSVAQIMIGDVDADGMNELVVTYLNVDGTYFSEIYDVICGGFKCQYRIQNIDFRLMTGMTAVPFILDMKGDGNVGIFIFNGAQRAIVSYTSNKQALTSSAWSNFIVSGGSDSYNLVTKHFASQIDLNGDCSADLLIVSQVSGLNWVVQLYTKVSGNKYSESSVTIYKDIAWLTFADIDANGAVDLFLISYENNIYVPYISYNVNTPQDICQTFSSPSFNFPNLKRLILPEGYNLIADSNPNFGDFNFDGYPDLLAIFSLNQFRIVSILQNSREGFFRFRTVDINEVQNIGNPLQAVPIDFTENGKLDIVVISNATKLDKTQAFVRTSIINNIIEDTLFIKILPLLPSSSSDLSSTEVTAAMGVTIEWRVTNIDGDKTISVLNQKFQWNYGSLQQPFVTSGLGRTNNYIEDLTVGYPGYGQNEAWTPIIPNSQLIVERVVNSGWMLQTLLKDNSRVYQVLYISIVCLFGLGMLIIFLNWRQNLEDKRDHYNFIQMIR